MKKDRHFTKLLSGHRLQITACIFLFANSLCFSVKAASFNWNAPGGGSWNTQANWGASTLPTTINDAAAFTNLDITADVTVTLDGNQSIGSLTFGDTATNSAAGWLINTGTVAGATLTIGGAAPVITVNALGPGKAVALNVPLSGSSGLTINNSSILNWNAPANFPGDITFAGTGKINLTGGDYFGDSPNLIFQGGTLVAGSSSEFAITNNIAFHIDIGSIGVQLWV